VFCLANALCIFSISGKLCAFCSGTFNWFATFSSPNPLEFVTLPDLHPSILGGGDSLDFAFSSGLSQNSLAFFTLPVPNPATFLGSRTCGVPVYCVIPRPLSQKPLAFFTLPIPGSSTCSGCGDLGIFVCLALSSAVQFWSSKFGRGSFPTPLGGTSGTSRYGILRLEVTFSGRIRFVLVVFLPLGLHFLQVLRVVRIHVFDPGSMHGHWAYLSAFDNMVVYWTVFRCVTQPFSTVRNVSTTKMRSRVLFLLNVSQGFWVDYLTILICIR